MEHDTTSLTAAHLVSRAIDAQDAIYGLTFDTGIDGGRYGA